MIINKKDGEKMSNKEQLLNELKQIKEEFNEKINYIQKQIDKEDSIKKYWTPNNGDKYYFITPDGGVSAYTDISDIRKINSLNCFKTKDQAERVAFEQLLHRKLKKFILEQNNEANWSNDNNKYNIWYDYKKNQLYTGCDNYERYFGQSYFLSREIAEKAIEEFKEDLIRYFTSDR